MDSKNQKQYTGTWVPAHVMESKELTPIEKFLYADIASFKHCYANNTFFAKRLGIANRSVQRCLTNLEKYGFIARFDDEKNERYIVALRDDPMTQMSRGGDTNVTGGMTFVSPIDNNLDNNIEKESIKKKISDDEKFNIEKLYKGWRIEVVVGRSQWLAAKSDLSLRTSLLEKATRKCKKTEKRDRLILARLRDSGVEDCIKAIINIAQSSHHMGENDRKWKATMEWLFETPEKIEKWANV